MQVIYFEVILHPVIDLGVGVGVDSGILISEEFILFFFKQTYMDFITSLKVYRCPTDTPSTFKY